MSFWKRVILKKCYYENNVILEKCHFEETSFRKTSFWRNVCLNDKKCHYDQNYLLKCHYFDMLTDSNLFVLNAN
jgi:hypothetical protein